jgi:uncharacterized protein (TIGR00369 family)
MTPFKPEGELSESGTVHVVPNSPFALHLGFEVVQALPLSGHATLQWQPQPEHLNVLGMVHGGACMSLLDVAMAHAARSAWPDVKKPMSCVTIEMKTTFMRPAQGFLTAQAQVVHRTATMAFVQAQLLDKNQHLCTHATGTYQYVRAALPSGFSKT